MSRITLPTSGLAEDILGFGREGAREMQIVTFTIGEQYAVPIDQVQEIIRAGNITNIPNAPVYMEGLINLRGRVLPVLNLRKRLRLPSQEFTKKSRIIVTESNSKTVGLLVDAVSHVIRVSPEVIDEAPEEVLDVDTDYITGVCKLPRGIVILLDLEKLLRRENVEMKEGGNDGEENQ